MLPDPAASIMKMNQFIGLQLATIRPGPSFPILPALGLLCLSAASTSAQNWMVTPAPSANWVSLACSADGNQLAALVGGGEAVYLSTNAGANWTLSSPPNGGALGSGIACSADGHILYFAGTGQIYSSTNSGATWNPTLSPFANWVSVACSADGSQVAGASALRRGSPSGIITSPDRGASWSSTTTPATDAWIAVAASADGSKLVGVDATATAISTSDNRGISWSTHSPPVQAFTALASSADGSLLVATSQGTSLAGGPIFISTNSGLNWVQSSAPLTNWASVACSADGRTILGAAGGPGGLGRLFLSTDSGATWSLTNSLLAHWSAVAVSADGSKLAAAENGGHIHTLQLSPPTMAPSMTIRPAGTNSLISWLVPALDFTLQQNIDPTSTNWVDVGVTPVLNLTDLHNEMKVPSTLGNVFFRLSSASGGLSGVQAIGNVLRGPWQTLVIDVLFTPTFNADGTFTATTQPPSGVISTDAGGWSLKPPLVPSGFINPQANLTLTNTQGSVVLSGDVLLINPDQLFMTSASNNFSSLPVVAQLVITKRTP